ncbi:MAG: DUF983 domain-containing protein [Sphingobacteriaceae bacterium]|nr:DUF983 domain-containing protein [Sphingobacteriaceae bacterium]
MAKVPLKTALAECRCPQCRTGAMFKYPALHLHKATAMHETCPHCGFKFEIEPGFFWGAMYISYAFGVAISVIFGVLANYLFNDPEIWVYMVMIFTPLLLVSPLSMRYSRVLMLYFFGEVSYRPE